jgi:type IV pilus assembly protein PilQ
MNAHKALQMMPGHRRAGTHAGVVAALTTMTAVAVGTMILSAARAPVPLLGVSVQGSTVTIEAAEPVAYLVNRPDPLTLVVDLRDASVGNAVARVQPQGLVSGIRLEQTSAADGLTVARVRITLARAAEYTVKSARNTIRVELTANVAAAGRTAPPPSPPPGPPAVPAARREPRPAPKPLPATAPTATPSPAPPAAAGAEETATTIDRVRATRKGTTTTVTISGNGRLSPTGVTESRDLPRRVILDFPNVTPRTAAQTAGDGEVVRRVRTAINSHTPLVTRVVMEIADGATYSVQRTAAGSRELSIVVEGAKTAGTSMRAPTAADDGGLALVGAETITLAQAMANGAALAPTEAAGVDAMAALKQPVATSVRPASSAPATPRATTARPAPQPAAAARQDAGPAAQTPAPPPAPTAQLPAPPPAPATSPVLQGPQSQQISAGQEKKYTGHPISMDFQGVDLRSVLRTFAEISGLNMVIDPDVQGTVDIVLTDVAWDQALEVILRGNSLDYTVDGTIVRIARMDTLRKEQDARTQLAQSAANAGALAVRTYTLSYAKAEQAAPLVKSSVLSPRGNVQIDARTNTLIITDLPARLETVSQLLATLDRAEPQVEIEARIITTTREFARALGVQWGFNGRVTPDIGNTTPFAFPNNGTLGGRTGGVQGPLGSDTRAGQNDAAGTAVNLGVPAATSAVGLALGSINGAFNLDVALSALERTGKGRILSTPRVTTQNNVEAEITQGVQIPVQTEANNTTTVTFKDAALTLKVTPQITASNTVIMQITVENASPGALVDTGAAQIPSIDTQRAITRVQVSDGMTTVMGGIFVSREQSTNDRTPLLHRVPFFGWLFRRDSQVDESRELLIFITPRIQKG